MSRKNKRPRSIVMTIENTEFPESWEIIHSAAPRVDIMPSRIMEPTGKDKRRADRRARKAEDRNAVDYRDLKESRFI